jgi:predicted transcriptional regulator
MSSKTRYTMDLDKQLDKALSELAERKGTSKAEIIKRALATYSFISGQAPANSNTKFSITTSDDKVLKDIIIP